MSPLRPAVAIARVSLPAIPSTSLRRKYRNMLFFAHGDCVRVRETLRGTRQGHYAVALATPQRCFSFVRNPYAQNPCCLGPRFAAWQWQLRQGVMSRRSFAPGRVLPGFPRAQLRLFTRRTQVLI